MLICENDTDSVVRDVVSGKIRPHGDRVIGLRDTGTDFDRVNGVMHFKIGGIHVPDDIGDWSNWVTILAVGPKCKHIRGEHVGWHGYLPEWDVDLHRVGGEVFIARENVFQMLSED